VVDVTLTGKAMSVTPPPALSSPKNSAPVYTFTPKLSWKAKKGTLMYHVLITDASGNKPPILLDSTKPSTVAPYLDFGIYNWQVSIEDASGESAYSAPYSFEVTLNKTPKKGAILKNGVVKFAWQGIKGATYELQVFTDNTDEATRASSEVFPIVSTSKPSYTMSKLSALPSGVYYWRVRANGGPWTLAWSFTVP
jgi:hypothetical protein